MNSNNNLPLTKLEKAHINDLADGQLRGAAFAESMALLEANPQARAYWHGLHVAGDVLRGEVQAHNHAKDVAFLDAFRVSLAREPHITSVVQQVQAEATASLVPQAAVESKPVANDSFFNWKWVGGLSAAAAVVAFSWNLVGTTGMSPNGFGSQFTQNAAQTAPVATPTSAGVMLRNPQLDALIAAHNQAGGSSALQVPSGFLRSATFNTDAAILASSK